MSKSQNISAGHHSLVVVCTAHGNADFRQYSDIADPENFPCNTLTEASAICLHYIHENDLGAGNWTGDAGIIYHPIKGAIARVSYNGRVWYDLNLKADGEEYKGDILNQNWLEL